jgi:hypothetical protein
LITGDLWRPGEYHSGFNPKSWQRRGSLRYWWSAADRYDRS